MYFDITIRDPLDAKVNTQCKISGINIVFVTPDNKIIMHSLTLSKGCSNNKAKYEVLIASLELALKLPIEHLIIYDDFELVVRQMNGLYHIK